MKSLSSTQNFETASCLLAKQKHRKTKPIHLVIAFTTCQIHESIQQSIEEQTLHKLILFEGETEKSDNYEKAVNLHFHGDILTQLSRNNTYKLAKMSETAAFTNDVSG